MATGSSDPVRHSDRFEFANGIALSPEGNLLYVSTYPGGITAVDLTTHIVSPISRPPELCLATIDGLYLRRGALIAFQNGFMTSLIVRLALTRDLRTIERFEILEHRNSLFERVATGVVLGGKFFQMANIQDDKKIVFNPQTRP